MFEEKHNFESLTDSESWSLIEVAARYYDFKKADGCSPSFLGSAKRQLQFFMTWLKQQGLVRLNVTWYYWPLTSASGPIDA